MPCSPQRYLANNSNVILGATLSPSSVLPVEDQVLEIPTARDGTAQLALSGLYTGAEEALFEFEIVDDTIETPRISAPILTGEGSGQLTGISASAVAQEFRVALAQDGIPLATASVDLEGVTVVARTAGAAGNNILITVDQSPLVFTPQAYSLLHDLDVGAGSESAPLEGPEHDFDTKILGADNAIPAGAHRIAFGDDRTHIYLQFKFYKDAKWQYRYVPEIKLAVPKGTVVNFVTGGRTVHVGTASPYETFTGIVTLYDLLNAIKQSSEFLDVEGVVANDRSPTGQASQELQTRTDAHVEPSYGDGSEAATGFENTSCSSDAGTQLVIATCVAVSSKDSPTAGVGREIWSLESSLLGDLGSIVTGVAQVFDDFSLTVPRKVPFGFGTQKGRFGIAGITYAVRDDGEIKPPICPVSLTLGPEAVDQTITLVYTKRPDGSCNCSKMPAPNLDTDCLGNIDGEGDGPMPYSSDAQTRYESLYTWAVTLVTACSRYIAGKASDGIPETTVTSSSGAVTASRALSVADDAVSIAGAAGLTGTVNFPVDLDTKTTGFADVAIPDNFQDCIDFYENALAQIDVVTDSGKKTAGFNKWDTALTAWQTDLATSALNTLGNRLETMANDKYKILVRQALAFAGIAQAGGADASVVDSGDGCWRDWGDAFYWDVVGSENGQYGWAFTNHPYYSVRRATVKDRYYATHEFALQVNVKPECIKDLKEGDTITLVIGGAGWPALYQVGDQLVLPIIGAAPLYLAAGQDASLVQLWYVTGSVSGALPPFSYNPDAPTPYSNGSPFVVAFTLEPGGIPFALADEFRFSSEGGHFKWRKDGGAWQPTIPIPAGAQSLDSGLSIEFTNGVAPSFITGDQWSFRALQPWAASNIVSPDPDPWRWSGTAGAMVADAGEVVDADGTAFAFYDLEDGATVTIEGGVSPGVYTWTETVTMRPIRTVQPFSQVRSARYFRLSVAGSTDGKIGWWWCGMMFATELAANSLPRLSFKMLRGNTGLNARGRCLGKGIGGDVEWTEAALSEADLAGLREIIEHVKTNDDEPLMFIPQITRPADAFLVQIANDDIDIPDLFDWQPDADHERRHSARLTLQSVYQ